jgi:hypothetical protein
MANRKAKTPKLPKTRRRYSIGEWYGSPFETISPAERFRNAQAEMETKSTRGLICPFKKDRPCHKKGGVCSLRLYEQTGDGPVRMTGPIITTCPARFIEDDVIFNWIGKELLGTDNPINLRQIGFLNRFQSPASEASDEEDEDKPDFIGRIDNVLIHPSKRPIDWCAVELQAVYFSGKAMGNEFEMMSKAEVTEFQFSCRE